MVSRTKDERIIEVFKDDPESLKAFDIDTTVSEALGKLAEAGGGLGKAIRGRAEELLDSEIGSLIKDGFPIDKIIGAPELISLRAIDIVKDPMYLWTSNTSAQARSLAPRIKIKLYQQNKGQLTEAVNRFKDLAGIVADGGVEEAFFGDDLSYRSLYQAVSIADLTLPFFSPDYIRLQHAFEGHKGAEALRSAAGGLGKAIAGTGKKRAALGDFLANLAGATTPGFFWENPRAWASTDDHGVGFAFNLYNTIGSKENIISTIDTHKQLVDILITINSIQKFGPSLTLPPMICSYEIEGIKYCPVANIGLDVKSLGQVTYKNGVHIPDAYEINITLNDMVTRSRSFHNFKGPNNKVKVISGPKGTDVSEKARTIHKNAALDKLAAGGT